ncbi:MAG TPA: hypothetical protein VJ770_19170 [Stellaceae bacterium]|nr:hypothetical protein [Stellaceae bacterium]
MSEQSRGAAIGGSTQGGEPSSLTADAVTDPLKTVAFNPGFHRYRDFRCTKSSRVQDFFIREFPRFDAYGYCKVFILPNPKDPTGIWGYYTVSSAELNQSELTKTQQRQTLGGYPVPLSRIGFMGRDDGSIRGLGEALLVDAARRVHRGADVNKAWGLILDAEGGAGTKLFCWYKETMKFTPLRDKSGVEKGTLYCPLRRLLPELGRN